MPISSVAELPLPRRFVLYVPSEPATGTWLCQIAERMLCKALGGVTSYPAKGTYQMGNGRLCSERVQVLESFCESSDWPKQHPLLLALAAVVGGLLGQEAIAIAIDGRMQLILPADLPQKPEELPMSADEEDAWLSGLLDEHARAESEG